MKKATSFLFGILACVLLAPGTYAGAFRTGRAVVSQRTELQRTETETQGTDLRQQDNAGVVRWAVDANASSCMEVAVRVITPCGHGGTLLRSGSNGASGLCQAARNLCSADLYFHFEGHSGPHRLVAGRSADYHIYALRHILI